MTLYEYYGGKLPSLTERSKTYRQHGGQGNYMGTVQQNNWLESKLRSGGLPSGSTVAFNSAPVAPAGPNNMTDWLNQNWGNLQGAQERIANARAGLEDPTLRYKRIRGETGVQESQDTLSGLMRSLGTQQGLLTDLEPGINQRMQGLGTQVTEAQRNRWVSNESQPIISAIDKISRAKAIEQEGLNMKYRDFEGLLGAASQGDERVLQPLLEALGLEKEKFGYGQKAFESDLNYRQSREAEERNYQRELEKERRAAARSSSSSGTSAAKAETQRRRDAVGEIGAFLTKNAGSDRYVNPANYREAKAAWRRQGFGTKEFDELFSDYRNPKQKELGYEDYVLG